MSIFYHFGCISVLAPFWEHTAGCTVSEIAFYHSWDLIIPHRNGLKDFLKSYLDTSKKFTLSQHLIVHIKYVKFLYTS